MTKELGAQQAERERSQWVIAMLETKQPLLTSDDDRQNRQALANYGYEAFLYRFELMHRLANADR